MHFNTKDVVFLKITKNNCLSLRQRQQVRVETFSLVQHLLYKYLFFLDPKKRSSATKRIEQRSVLFLGYCNSLVLLKNAHLDSGIHGNNALIKLKILSLGPLINLGNREGNKSGVGVSFCSSSIIYLLVQDIGNEKLPSSLNDRPNENATARHAGLRLVSQRYLRQGSHHAP
ncbi:MAG: hypothetical protein EZS28_005788 [Streblomastix strix]|uniref:Uncharacterized protein n=1 Tax=Streblomastix strix TaxID=222440 RepID=A0A5J4WW10_9EUKA|nr:MAG: hypothetical protein EZS28_005788 [Streblomastix strix]